MPVRTFSVGALIGLLLIFCAASGFAQSEPDRPNILYIHVDDLGWADLGPYGAELHDTPNIDRLAEQGVRFTDAYAAAPVCTPTRAALMTGDYPARLHMTVWHEASDQPPQDRRLVPPVTVGNLPHGQETVAEVLHAEGYLTAHVGKWHLGTSAFYPQTHGFDVNIGGTHWGAPNTYFYPYTGDETYPQYRYVPDLSFGEEGEYLTDRLTSEAIGVIEKATQRETPFFLHMAYHSVHTPIEAKQEDVATYRERLRPEFDHQNPAFAAMVHSVDENVGRLLESLDERGISDQTVVILTSDNGGYIGEDDAGRRVTNNAPLRSGKGSLYEGGIRVPLIVRWPGVTRAGAVSDEPVITMDMYPTILGMTGTSHAAETPSGDGESLVPILRGEEETLDRASIYFHYPHYYSTTSPVSALRSGRWKLLYYYEDHRVELYDLREDRGEEENLAAEMPERARRLQEELLRWLDVMEAQRPAPNVATEQ